VTPRHFESHAEVAASPAELFALLDDHSRLSAHMTKRSWMMAGSRITLETDANRGRAVGSRIRLAGRILGFELSVDEVVTEREPPHAKTWQTIGSPRLLVIGPYRMGFRIEAVQAGSRLTVFIDWTPPSGALARLFGPSYARWCTERMARDALAHFAQDGKSLTSSGPR